MNKQSGQTTIEFVLTMILLLAFLLFFLQLCMVFAFGNYVHYATFMAARAYLSSGPNPQDQQDRAKAVITQMLKRSGTMDKFPSIAQGQEGDGDIKGLSLNPPQNYNPTDESFSWLQGVRYTFKSRLFIMPLAGLSQAAASSQSNAPSIKYLNLTSESWLGKEPAESDCRAVMKGLFDNGC